MNVLQYMELFLFGGRVKNNHLEEGIKLFWTDLGGSIFYAS